MTLPPVRNLLTLFILLTFGMSLFVMVERLRLQLPEEAIIRKNVPNLITEWKDCITRGNILSMFSLLEICEKVFEFYDITSFSTESDIKYHILPKEKTIKSLVLSLNLTNAYPSEKMLKTAMYESVDIVGTGYKSNKSISFMKIYPYELTLDGGIANSTELIETMFKKEIQKLPISLNQTVQMKFRYFIRHLIQKHTIDALWVKYNSVKEAQLFLDNLLVYTSNVKSTINVCQVNLQIKGNRKTIHNVVKGILKNHTYAILRTNERKGYINIYLGNFKDNACFERYRKIS